MASRSSHSGKRPRTPGERTEKERRAPQGPGGHGSTGTTPTHARAAGHGGSRRGGLAGGQGGGKDGTAAYSRATTRGDHSISAGQAGADKGHIGPAGADTHAGMVIIYGRNPVREALRGRRRVRTVWLATGTHGDDLARELTGWLDEVAGSTPDVRRVGVAQLTALAGSADHQGLVAGVDPYPYVDPEGLLESSTLIVALHEVQDPHNLGAIIRTAEGAAAGVVIPRHRAAEVTATVVKAAAGATEHAAVAQVRNLADFLIAAKAAGFWVYGAAAGAPDSYAAQEYRHRTCFVLGSEGQGLGKRVEAQCDVLVGLPLRGKVESLNVSVSAGVLLYEAVRQRDVAGDATVPRDAT